MSITAGTSNAISKDAKNCFEIKNKKPIVKTMIGKKER